MAWKANGRELKTFGEGPDINGPEPGLEKPADKDLNNILVKIYNCINDENKVGFI